MMQQPGTTTDQLSDIIRVIQLARRTVLLAIERDGTGGKLEKGTITFVNGQISDAQVDQRIGLEAFRWLNSWKVCRYSLNPLPSPNDSASPFSLTHLTKATTPAHSNGYYHQPTPVEAAPRRIQSAEDVLSIFDYTGLTRTHRHLFLLIDGRRTISELTHLLGRRAEEVNELLSALERAGFIQR